MNYLTRIQSVMSKRCPKDDKGTPWKFLSMKESAHQIGYAFHTPNGFSSLDLEKHIDALSATCGKLISIENLLGAVIVTIPKTDFTDVLGFQAQHIGNGSLIFGYDITGEPVTLNPVNKHCLLSGASGYGKTDTLRYYMLQIIHHEPDALLYVIDMKGCSFIPFEKWNLIEYADDLEGAYDFLTYANAERKRRSKMIRKAGSRKAVDPLPSIYLIIDEFADLPPNPSMKKGYKDDGGTYIMGEKDYSDGCMSALSSLTRIGRELKINVFLCTQYPLASLIGPQIKANMINRVSLKLEEPIQSQVVLDSDAAYLLPSDKRGRAYVKNQGLIQIPYVGDDNAWERLLEPYQKEGYQHDNETTNDYDNLI